MEPAPVRTKFHVEIIKPSHYDDDGYVIQWLRAFIPSNSLACLYALVDDVRQAAGPGRRRRDRRSTPTTRSHTVIPVKQIIRRIKAAAAAASCCWPACKPTSFPGPPTWPASSARRASPVAIGGFHVSGCLSMLPELPPDIAAVQELGVTLVRRRGRRPDGAVACATPTRGELQAGLQLPERPARPAATR